MTGCSNDDGASSANSGEIGMELTSDIKAASMDESVHSFFQDKIQKAYLDAGYHAKDGFSLKENTCFRIDSKEELKAMYQGTDELPEIDFSKYTLLLGSKVYCDFDTDVENIQQVLTESRNSYNLNLISTHREGDWGSASITLQILYYGFYPKLKDKEITVNLIYE